MRRRKDGAMKVAARVYVAHEAGGFIRDVRQRSRVVTTATGFVLPQTLAVVERLARENRV